MGSRPTQRGESYGLRVTGGRTHRYLTTTGGQQNRRDPGLAGVYASRSRSAPTRSRLTTCSCEGRISPFARWETPWSSGFR